MNDAIAIVGMGCRYPDAHDPDRLWEMVLSQRRAFRPIPPERLNAADYFSADPDDADRTYVQFAGVLEGWDFDRARHRVPGPTHRVTDATHWLALDVAADTLAAAGFPHGRGLDTERTGVVVGNSLTGEFSRAALMRTRWPYVERVLHAAITEAGSVNDVPPERLGRLLARIEELYKSPFPVPTDESLAGGLANTIAGRICNHFDLQGGGYIVDGACSSSLLAIVTACSTLRDGDLDLVLAGGVDLSLDPFELVGFARTGALARSAMRVYDAAPTGFWPGEGCGMVALMRADDALAAGRTPIALIRGWGISSDGSGGITRPERQGQLLALRRAYQRAGFGPETVALFEGHGTGTAVGDQVEITALIDAQAGRRTLPPAALGSIKANIGHTKAAAGVAGLLKAALALQRQVLPPTTGCEEPHELLGAPGAPLQITREAAPWPAAPLRAAVSAMGFGGINTHIVLEADAPRRQRQLSPMERRAARRPLSHEVFVVGAASGAELAKLLSRVADLADRISTAEHVDMAAALAVAAATEQQPCRIALVAHDPAQLGQRARRALELLPSLAQAPAGRLVVRPGILACYGEPGRVGLLFTGQGAPIPTRPGALGSVFPDADRFFGGLSGGFFGGQEPGAGFDTAVAQPATVRAALAGLNWLTRLGVDAHAAVGHSLGEITALCWAGALAETDAIDLVTFRGRVMSDLGKPGTGMAAISASPEAVRDLIADTDLVIAADNGAAQVVAGTRTTIDQVVEQARAAGVGGRALPVSHAFHSWAVQAAEQPLAVRLAEIPFAPVQRPVHSTVEGRLLTPADDLRQTLSRQVTSPVLFRTAVEALAADCELFVEVGPGSGLATLAAGITDVPAVALDVGAESAEALCRAAAALFAVGAVRDLGPMFTERFHRPFDIWREPRFLGSPCEVVPARPARQDGSARLVRLPKKGSGEAAPDTQPVAAANDVAATVRQLLAAALELAPEAIGDTDRLLSDLHLNSLRVAQIAAQAAVSCARALPAEPLSFADAAVTDLITTIAALPAAEESTGSSADSGPVPPGVSEWHHVLTSVTEPIDVPPIEERYAWQVYGRGHLRASVEPLLTADPAAANAPNAPNAIVVFHPAEPGAADVTDLVAATRAAVTAGLPLAVVDHGGSASGFLGTIRQEYPGQRAQWICASAHSEAAAVATAATSATVARFLQASGNEPAEVIVDEAGQAAIPAFRPAWLGERAATLPLGPDDVVLITGGGKGIGFESALGLVHRYGVRIALIGRGDPRNDDELRVNIARLGAAGTAVRYERADVTDAVAVQQAIAELTRALGPVTAVLHSSGVNRPGRFADLDAAAFAEHAAPKCDGLRNVVDAIDADRLRILVTFGSVIGRFGLAGEAHYALANGQLGELVRRLARDLPSCWVCNIDWTAWSGAGMGERLEILDSLLRIGVVPVPAQRGVEMLIDLLEARPAVPTVLATGRLPSLDRGLRPSAGSRRFAERVVTHTPSVELITEADLTPTTDAFLADHRIDGLAVLPAVGALEAMAQAAYLLTGRRPTGIVAGRFERPVVVPDDGWRTIRMCALARADGDVDVALRSDETGFAVDHFACRITAEPSELPDVRLQYSQLPGHDGSQLYGSLLFHGPLYQRTQRYEHLEATGCTAVLSAAAPQSSEPAFLLGDLTRNDASIHALQACVPHRRLLPVGCSRFTIHANPETDPATGPVVLSAVEREHSGVDYVYDVVARGPLGRPVLSWTGLQLRDVGPIAAIARWPKFLLGPYLQRAINALLPDADVRLNVVASVGGRSQGSSCVPGDKWSRSHVDGMVLAASGVGRVACDWEWIQATDEVADLRRVTPWSAQAEQLVRLTGEPEGNVRMRLWTVHECLCKAGRTTQGPLTVRGAYEQGWVVMRAGQDDVVSTVVHVEGDSQPVAVAVLVRRES